MSQTLITPDIIANEGRLQLENNLVMGGLVHLAFRNEFVKIGDTVNIPKPVKFEAKDGATRVNQDVEEATTPFVINKRKHVSWKFSTKDLTLTVEQYSERYIKPACIALANIVDRDLCTLYQHVYQFTGTAGTTPNSYKAFASPMKRLNHSAVDQDMRKIVVDPEAELEATDVLRQQNSEPMVESSVRQYKVGRVGAAQVLMDQNIRRHVAGTGWGTPLVDGGTQAVTYENAGHTYGGTSQTLNVKGLDASGAVKAGDKFTLAGVYAINPVSKDTLGFLQEFTVNADGTAAGGGTIAINVSPAIITSGPYKTVSAQPANNAEVVVTDDYTANLAFHKNALGLVMVPLEMPDGVAFKSRKTHNNVSMRVVKDYDIEEDEDIIRLDIMYGVKVIYPELAVVLMG